MSRPFDTPKQALAAMLEAGAEFAIHPRSDSLAPTFTYSVRQGGDRDRCRAILSAVKAKPPQFFEAFRIQAPAIAEAGGRRS